MTTVASPIAVGPATRAPGTPGATATRNPQGALGKDDFLKLLTAQLRNQDPQSPMNADQMAAQLAQFTSVEQLTNIAKSLEAQATAQSSLLNAVAAGTAAGNIGRIVTAKSDLVELDGSGKETLVVTGSGGPAELNVFDARTGKPIATHSMGSLGAGANDVVIGRALADLPPGVYRVTVTPLDPKAPNNWTTAVRGRVSGLETSSGGLLYALGNLRIPLAAVTEISTK
jgi:flagellar basal-body rod modification protein FlgD